jgi:hypothetical protein
MSFLFQELCKKRYFSFFWVFSLLTACGYRWEPEYPTAARPSITVPFILGDEDGMLTSSIVQALGSSGLVSVRNHNADYRLEVSIVDHQTGIIGFRIDPQKIRGQMNQNILACEGRKSMALKATLYVGSSDKIAYGPYEVVGDADYDFIDGDSLSDLTFLSKNGAVTEVLPFSLGQLEPSESAQEAATRPLYHQLANKIVDAIAAEW